MELWHVHAKGRGWLLSPDELDRAYETDEIDEETWVRKPGHVRWTTLASAAGLEAPKAKPPPLPKSKPPPAPPPPKPLTKREVAKARPPSLVPAIVAAVLIAGGVLAARSGAFDGILASLAKKRDASEHATAPSRTAVSLKPPDPPPPSAKPKAATAITNTAANTTPTATATANTPVKANAAVKPNAAPNAATSANAGATQTPAANPHRVANVPHGNGARAPSKPKPKPHAKAKRKAAPKRKAKYPWQAGR